MALATTGQLTSVACLDRSQAGSQKDMRPARSHQTRSELAVSIELLAVIDQPAPVNEPPDFCTIFSLVVARRVQLRMRHSVLPG